MDMMLIDYLMQAVDEYNEAQPDEGLRLDWWELIENIDENDEQTVINLTLEIKHDTILLKEGKGE